MEDLVIGVDFWRGRRVFLTGHTGFKGAWMCLLLATLGARVRGYALAPESDSLFISADIARDIGHGVGDVRSLTSLQNAITAADPDIVIHMAAQSLVRASYEDPVATYETNVMGTVNLLEAVRRLESVRCIIVVTSDKCYENRDWVWAYRETDTLGGHDPYSNSKACAELIVDAYRRSFFGRERGGPALATGRAGNVIGGGDVSRDRLIPDAMRAFRSGIPLRIRNPRHVRPWQHVLDVILGYLCLAEQLTNNDSLADGAWNFGPTTAVTVDVATLAARLAELWERPTRIVFDPGPHPHESITLNIDATKAVRQLGWKPLLDYEASVQLTVDWYRAVYDGAHPGDVTRQQIHEYLAKLAAGPQNRPH